MHEGRRREIEKGQVPASVSILKRIRQAGSRWKCLDVDAKFFVHSVLRCSVHTVSKTSIHVCANKLTPLTSAIASMQYLIPNITSVRTTKEIPHEQINIPSNSFSTCRAAASSNPAVVFLSSSPRIPLFLLSPLLSIPAACLV